MNNKFFKIGDIFIYFLFLLIIFVIFHKATSFIDYNNKFLKVYIDGKLKYNFQLTKNPHIVIIKSKYGEEKIKIKNFSAKKISATCPNKICLKMHKISKVGDSIICIPNKEVIIITSKSLNNIDTVDAILK